MIASITVRARIRVALAPFRVPLTASAYCWLVASARKRGMLAADVAAVSAALQLATRSDFVLLIAFCASARDSCRRNATNMSERMG